jgi:adenylate cyclase
MALDASGNRTAAEAVARDCEHGLRHQLELDPDDPRAHYMLAGMLARLGRGDEGKPHIEKALSLRPDDFSTLYNAACYYAQAGDVERGLDLLEAACRFGGGSRDWIEHDSDLDALRAHPRFRQILAGLDVVLKDEAG